MKALVLGATGHIGNAVVRELLSQGYQVTATGRRKELPANLASLPVRYVPGDSNMPGQFERWISRHQVVIDAAAPYPLLLFGSTTDKEPQPLAHAAERTRLLLDTVHRHNARLVYVSSFTTLLRPREGLGGWRDQLVRALHPYFAVKTLIETQVREAAQHGLPAVIVNPTMCLGPWDMRERHLCFVPQLLCGEIPVAVQHILNVIDVRDVATGIVAALKAERYGEPILLSGHNISTEALFAWVCAIGKVQPPRFFAPATLSLWASYWTEVALGLMGQRAPLPSLAVMLACEHEWMTPGVAQHDLGLTPRPLSETLLDTVAWYRGLRYC